MILPVKDHTQPSHLKYYLHQMSSRTSKLLLITLSRSVQQWMFSMFSKISKEKLEVFIGQLCFTFHFISEIRQKYSEMLCN